MIRNDVQYRVTKAHAAQFERALKDLEEKPPKRLAENKALREIYAAGIRSQLADLTEEIDDYEALSKGERPLTLQSFEGLPELLVRARISAGLTQKELAGRLSMKQQQVQRYESTDYAGASFSRLKEVASALGLRVTRPAVMETNRAKGVHVGSGARRVTAAKAAKKTATRRPAKARKK